MRKKIKRITRRPATWLVSTIVGAFLIASITWYVNRTLDNSERTMIYEYTFKEPKGGVKPSSAECWVGGMGNRADAFKCKTGNDIYTPCFKSAQTTNLVDCPSDPENADESTYLEASFPVDDFSPADYYGQSPLPWFVILNSGERCKIVYGMSDFVANRRIDFMCDDENTQLLLPTHDSEGVINIGCIRESGFIEQCGVEQLWL